MVTLDGIGALCISCRKIVKGDVKIGLVATTKLTLGFSYYCKHCKSKLKVIRVAPDYFKDTNEKYLTKDEILKLLI